MDDIFKFFGIMVALAIAVTFGTVLIRVASALTRRLEGREGRVADEELAYLRDQAEVVNDLRERVVELENRVDFAERLLAAPEGGSPAPVFRGNVGPR